MDTNIEHLPRFYQEHNGRIRILWIEDNRSQIITELHHDQAKLFYICIVKKPKSLKRILDINDGLAKADDEEQIPFLPFDVYVTDFRLFNEDGMRLNPEDEKLGIRSPAAGFLLGLFTALRNPNSPQVVIPYSAFPDQFGNVWKLADSMCPTSVMVESGRAVGKESMFKEEVPFLAAKLFRKTFIESLRSKQIHIRLDDVIKLEDLAKKSKASNVEADTELKFFVDNTLRTIKLGALFFDLTIGELKIPGAAVPHETIRNELLDKIPAREPIEEEAREIAKKYWNLQESEESRKFYETVFRQIDEEKPIKYPSGTLPDQEWFGVVGNDEMAREAKRVALIILMLHLHCNLEVPHQLLNQLYDFDDIDGSLPLDQIRSHIENKIAVLVEYSLVQKGLDALFDEAKSLALSTLDDVLDYMGKVGRDPQETFERLLIRCLDPFPNPVTSVKEKILIEEKIGRGLSRLFLKKRSISIRDLLAGRFDLDTRTAEIARRFAIEHIPTRAHWPKWLYR